MSKRFIYIYILAILTHIFKEASDFLSLYMHDIYSIYEFCKVETLTKRIDYLFICLARNELFDKQPIFLFNRLCSAQTNLDFNKKCKHQNVDNIPISNFQSQGVKKNSTMQLQEKKCNLESKLKIKCILNTKFKTTVPFIYSAFTKFKL